MPEEGNPSPLESPARRRSSVLSAMRALLRTRMVAGLLTVIPIWVTWVVASFVFDSMKSATEPVAWWFANRVQQETKTVPLPQERKLEVQRELIEQVVTDLVARSTSAAEIPDDEKRIVVDEIVRKMSYVIDEVPEAPAGLLNERYLVWIVPLLAVLFTLFLLYALGLLTASVFGRRMIMLVERLFQKVPLVKQVYGSTKQVVLTLGGGEMHAAKFKRVVLVEFPHPGMKCIAFLTAVMKDADTGRPMASIFIATTPNPTTGYMQIVPLQDVSETDWTVEDAVKLLMSGGILSPATVRFDKIHPVRWEKEERPTPSVKQDMKAGETQMS